MGSPNDQQMKSNAADGLKRISYLSSPPISNNGNENSSEQLKVLPMMQTIGEVSNPKTKQLSIVMESTQINNKAHLFQINNVQKETD